MSTTIKDIATKAGVSSTTVSLVLNGKAGRVSKGTWDRILEIAQELNYVPNQIAVSLATKKTYTLGLMIPDLTNLYLCSIASGVEKYAQAHGYAMFLCNTSENVNKCVTYINEFVKRCIDGIVVIPPSNINDDGNYELISRALESSKIPYILVDRAILHLFHDFITIDNTLGGYTATSHLLNLGHKKIGCITGPLTEFGAKRRLNGYKDALLENGIALNDNFIFEGNYHFDSGFNGAERLINQNVTAIFACNDMMALGVNKKATDMGISIPDELSLVGFDNNPIAEFLNLSLTTISQPSDVMGRRACEILIERINNSELPHKDYLYSPNLIVRNSTAEPRKL